MQPPPASCQSPRYSGTHPAPAVQMAHVQRQCGKVDPVHLVEDRIGAQPVRVRSPPWLRSSAASAARPSPNSPAAPDRAGLSVSSHAARNISSSGSTDTIIASPADGRSRHCARPPAATAEFQFLGRRDGLSAFAAISSRSAAVWASASPSMSTVPVSSSGASTLPAISPDSIAATRLSASLRARSPLVHRRAQGLIDDLQPVSNSRRLSSDARSSDCISEICSSAALNRSCAGYGLLGPQIPLG